MIRVRVRALRDRVSTLSSRVRVMMRVRVKVRVRTTRWFSPSELDKFVGNPINGTVMDEFVVNYVVLMQPGEQISRARSSPPSSPRGATVQERVYARQVRRAGSV